MHHDWRIEVAAHGDMWMLRLSKGGEIVAEIPPWRDQPAAPALTQEQSDAALLVMFAERAPEYPPRWAEAFTIQSIWQPAGPARGKAIGRFVLFEFVAYPQGKA